MNEVLKEFLAQGLQNACGWTTQAKLMWFGFGTGFGVLVSAIFAFIMKGRDKENG